MPTKPKPRVNLTMDRTVRRLANRMRKDDHRASLVNMLEHLVLAEAQRRGLYPRKEEKAA